MQHPELVVFIQHSLVVHCALDCNTGSSCCSLVAVPACLSLQACFYHCCLLRREEQGSAHCCSDGSTARGAVLCCFGVLSTCVGAVTTTVFSALPMVEEALVCSAAAASLAVFKEVMVSFDGAV